MNKALFGWIMHSYQACDIRLQKFNPAREPIEVKYALEAELKFRQTVIDAIRSDMVGALDHKAMVWYGYMMNHARLQVQRSEGQLTEWAFHAACKQLREHRNKALGIDT